MAQITRFTPIDEMFDDLLRGFFVRPVGFEGASGATGAAAPVQMKIDVREDEKSYTILADLPGVKKEDIQVHVDGNQVSLAAEVRREKDVKEGERVLRSERYVGRVARSFSLAAEVDSNAAQAKYADGVLELVLPKKTTPGAKQLTIQ
jgi:HSP20 family protein